MKRTGAELAVHALEQLGVHRTFGIPGVHNTELYDALALSKSITPYLVTHELSAAFMADGLSRTSDEVGTLVIVPGAGTTHALSGIVEAYLDGIPMLIISGGIRRDTGHAYQLHDIDQGSMLAPVTKAYFQPQKHADVISSIYQAFDIAMSGVPGPAFVEIPVNLQLFKGDVERLEPYRPSNREIEVGQASVDDAVRRLRTAKQPGMFVGWGAVDAADILISLADLLVAPVATTLQGLSSFPANHPFHTGVGFGPAAVPAARNAFDDCDCLLAVGVRFSELGTGSYGLPVPENLIHIDIDPEVFGRNYPVATSILGDSRDVATQILAGMDGFVSSRSAERLARSIGEHKRKYAESWLVDSAIGRVSPGPFFKQLRAVMPDDSFIVVDDGIHTFLTAELYPVRRARGFISPTDFNAMGYAVPAAIGTRMGHPDKQVAAIVGDGAFLMTGMELITAARHGIGVTVFVFHDGELGQISQFQEIPLNRKTCTVLGDLNVAGVAAATGCAFLEIDKTQDVERIVPEACRIAASGHPVIVDVRIDYSRKTCLTKGVVQTNLSRFPLSEKARFIGRAAIRHLFR